MTLVRALSADRFYVILDHSMIFYDASEPEGEILQNIHSAAWACKSVRPDCALDGTWDMMGPVDSGCKSHCLVTLSSQSADPDFF